MVNTIVYIISLSLQVATFAINYKVKSNFVMKFDKLKENFCQNKGRPFMESLRENRPLLYSILFSAGAVFVLVARLSPDTCDQFQIVEIPDDVNIMRF